jgi:hypothetical protein
MLTRSSIPHVLLPFVSTAITSQDQRLRGPARALLVIDQLVLADVVKLALNHGHYCTRGVKTVKEAAAALVNWRPHLLVLGMDITGSGILERLAGTRRRARPRLRPGRDPSGHVFCRHHLPPADTLLLLSFSPH